MSKYSDQIRNADLRSTFFDEKNWDKNSNSIFDIKINEEMLEKIKNKPPFEPDKYEPKFTVSQLFETGIEATLHFVIRHGEIIYYNSTQKRIN